MIKNTNEETVTLSREKYDELISNLGMAIGMLRGLGIRFDREILGRSSTILMGVRDLKKIAEDCREVADGAQQIISEDESEVEAEA